jgi:hypothetical protein
VFLLFGLRLVYTAIQLFRHRNQDPHVEDNLVLRLTRRLIPQVATSTSLVVIGMVRSITVVASLLKARRDPGAHPHAGSLRDHRDEPARAGA